MDSVEYRQVPNLGILQKLPTPKEKNEIVHCTDTDELYVWNGESWVIFNEVISGESGLRMPLYELNKAVVSQIPVLDADALAECEKAMNAWHCDKVNKYYMLYGREISYFTIVHVLYQLDADHTATFGATVIECLSNVGDIRSIDLVEDGSAFEIWVTQNDATTCLYLFPYDDGIVEVGM